MATFLFKIDRMSKQTTIKKTSGELRKRMHLNLTPALSAVEPDLMTENREEHIDIGKPRFGHSLEKSVSTAAKPQLGMDYPSRIKKKSCLGF
jgi:hypothetical protein